jgi:CMP-N-acetylneuraminic acid synthetase
MKIICMIPARLGSQRVKKKNLRLINDKPLIQYVIDTVKESKIFDSIYLNSESNIFKKIAEENKINFYKRDKNFSTNKSTNDDFAFDFIKNVQGDILVQILPTSPLINLNEINNFVNYYLKNKIKTLISVCNHQIATVYNKKPINFVKTKKNPPSQKMIPVQSYATVLMAWDYKNFTYNMNKYNSAYHGGYGKTDFFPLSPLSSIDIDEEDDFLLVEKIILSSRFKKKKVKYYK